MEKSQKTWLSESNKQTGTVSTQLKIVAKNKAAALLNLSVPKRTLHFCNDKSSEKMDASSI